MYQSLTDLTCIRIWVGLYISTVVFFISQAIFSFFYCWENGSFISVCSVGIELQSPSPDHDIISVSWMLGFVQLGA